MKNRIGMKRILMLMFVLMNVTTNSFAAHSQKNDKLDIIHPLCWFSGMADSSLQILLHGEKIGGMTPSLKKSENVRIDEVVKTDNPNFLILYLDLKDAPAQTFTVVLSEDGRKIEFEYELKPKRKYSGRSYDSSDVVYLLMPDRFSNGSKDNDVVEGMREQVCDPSIPLARHGGDLQGMTSHLDYLADLGVTAVWPTPLMENDMAEESYHGYAITDYYKVDPRYGTNEDYRKFVDEAHKRGLKVVQDMVFNHCGSFNPIYTDLPARDWFNNGSQYVQSSYRTAAVNDNHITPSGKSLTVDGWFVKTMPDWNQRNRLVRDYLIQTSIWWIEYAGIDGIRQDTYPYCDFDAMVKWCDRIELEYPGFNIVGEAWINNNVGVAWWQKDSKLSAPLNTKLPTVMDFPLMALLNYVCDETTDAWDHGFARLYEYLGQDVVFSDPSHILTFLDNHDTDRFQKNAEMALDTTRYKQALTLLLTLRGIPQVYYGDEIGMAANKGKGDGALRQDFPGGWPGDTNNAFTLQGRTELQNWYFNTARNLLRWRRTAKAVQYGNLTHFHVRDGVYVYSRKYEGQTVTVMLNGTKENVDVNLEPYREVLPKLSAVNIINHRPVGLHDKVFLQPKEVMVLDFR